MATQSQRRNLYNTSVMQGEDLVLALTYLAPELVTDYTFELLVYDDNGDSALTGTCTPDGGSNSVTCRVTAVQTAGLTIGTYHYVVRATNVSTSIKTIEVRGRLVVEGVKS